MLFGCFINVTLPDRRDDDRLYLCITSRLPAFGGHPSSVSDSVVQVMFLHKEIELGNTDIHWNSTRNPGYLQNALWVGVHCLVCNANQNKQK